jgi:tetratricopeptide (TPR) repeat protein
MPEHPDNSPHSILTRITKATFSLGFVIIGLLALKPYLAEQLLSRADAYASNGLYRDCERACRKLVLIEPQNADAWHRLGRAYKYLDAEGKAIDTFLQVLELDPDHRSANFDLAMIYVLSKEHQKAIPYLEKNRQLGPEDPNEDLYLELPYHRSSLDMLALCYERLGNLGAARTVREERKSLYPDAVSAPVRDDLPTQDNGTDL